MGIAAITKEKINANVDWGCSKLCGFVNYKKYIYAEASDPRLQEITRQLGGFIN